MYDTHETEDQEVQVRIRRSVEVAMSSVIILQFDLLLISLLSPDTKPHLRLLPLLAFRLFPNRMLPLLRTRKRNISRNHLALHRRHRTLRIRLRNPLHIPIQLPLLPLRPRRIPLHRPKLIHPRPRQEPRLHPVFLEKLLALLGIIKLPAALGSDFLGFVRHVQLVDLEEAGDGGEWVGEEVGGGGELGAKDGRVQEGHGECVDGEGG